MRIKRAGLWAALLAVNLFATDYRSALPGYRYEFPRDHFSHPDFQTEWWYYTGNLRSAEGGHFGFELTFFREAVGREAPRDSQSPWSVRDRDWPARAPKPRASGTATGRCSGAETPSRFRPSPTVSPCISNSTRTSPPWSTESTESARNRRGRATPRTTYPSQGW